MTQTAEQLDPQSLVARIIAELRANPEAQQLLLRAILTQEFLGMPTRLERIEADVAELNRRVTRIESDIADLKEDVAVLKTDVAVLKIDVASLKGDSLEVKLVRRYRSLINQRLGLRRSRFLLSAVAPEMDRELSDRLDEALESGLITQEQDSRVDSTDLIVRAQRRSDSATVWVAVEASNTIAEYDIDRARESADVLRTVFEEDAIAVVMGYAIRAEDQERAEERGVEVFVLPQERPPSG